MQKPEQHPHSNAPEEVENREDAPPTFEDNLMLVLNGPMCFECIEETEPQDKDPEGEANE